MSNLIDRDAFEVVSGFVPEGYDVESYLAGNKEILEMIDAAPVVDAVPVGVLEQYIWERDCAISQLKEIGKGFGERMDDVAKTVRCGECKHRRKPLYPHPTMIWCPMIEHHHHPDWFCAYGKKEEK